MPFARAGSIQIHYELHGPAIGTVDAAPALLIMGLASDAHAWEKQLPALSASRPVVAFDNRGCGRSSKPAGAYTSAEMAADAVAVLDAAGVARAHVVGMSLGGLVAQELALLHPGRVRSLALLATFAHADLTLQRAADAGIASTSDAGDLASLVEALSRGAANVDFFVVFAYLTKLVFSTAYLKDERAYLSSFFARSLQYGVSIDGLAGQIQAAIAHDTRERLVNLNVPTLVALGTADALVPPNLSRVLASKIPRARLVEVENGPHGLNFESAQVVNKLLSEWFFENDQGEYAANLRTIG
jgi:pimeloyl-ACP methyl ester carboxylesterase